MNFMDIKHYDTLNELEKCFKLMKVLRPKLATAPEFAEQVQRQQESSYRLLGLELNGKVIGLAGYRESENLVHGKFIYVDDLVTDPEMRSQKLGSILLEQISLIAEEKNKVSVVLDTAMANTQAQKFYYREGFLGLGMHFIKRLKIEG